MIWLGSKKRTYTFQECSEVGTEGDDGPLHFSIMAVIMAFHIVECLASVHFVPHFLFRITPLIFTPSPRILDVSNC